MRSQCIIVLSFLLAFALLIEAATNKTQPDALARRQTDRLEKRSKYHGKATWFVPSLHGGSMGACWEYEADNEYVVAMVRV